MYDPTNCFAALCLSMRGNIIAGNTQNGTTGSPDIYIPSGVTTVSHVGGSVVGDNTGVESYFPAGLRVGTAASPVDPLLTVLGNYGGPTPTLLPLPGSVAIDGLNVLAGSPVSDQRGFGRPGTGTSFNDIGAVERQASDPVDSDGDRLVDVVDNCPTVRNESQADSDADGLGDLCEPLLNLADDGSSGSLRDIIDRATDEHVITFDPAVSGGSIVLTGGELIVSNELTIDTSNLPLGLTLSANNASRVIHVTAAGNLRLNGLIIRDGQEFTAGCILNEGLLDIVDSTITGCNVSSIGSAIRNPGSMAMTNTTVAGNSQDALGAILNFGNATIVHSTVSDNHSSTDDPAIGSGGIFNCGQLTLENSIVAGNTGGTKPDIFHSSGAVIASGANLVGDNSSVETFFPPGPLVGTAAAPLDPQLNVLGDYSGPTPTMTPVAGSPAVDAAVATGSSPSVDQRGVGRPQGAANDLGGRPLISIRMPMPIPCPTR